MGWPACAAKPALKRLLFPRILNGDPAGPRQPGGQGRGRTLATMKRRPLWSLKQLALRWACYTAFFGAVSGWVIYRYTSQLGLAVLDVVVISILIGSSLIAINVFFDVVDRTFVARPPGLSLSSYLLRLAGATALFVLGFLSLGGLGAVGAARFYDWATRPDIAPTWRIVAVLVVTLVVSVGLFLFRLKARCVYGCTEALAGLYAAQSVTTGDKHGLPFSLRCSPRASTSACGASTTCIRARPNRRSIRCGSI